MDLSLPAPIRNLLFALAVALMLLLSLRSLGFGWQTSLVLALLPMVLGTLNIMARQVYALSALTMIVACVVAFGSGESEKLSPHLEAATAAAAGAMHKAGELLPASATSVMPATPVTPATPPAAAADPQPTPATPPAKP